VNPKKHKHFKKGIADEIGVHENVVDDFIDFYFSRVRKMLSSIEHPRVFVDGLGTFSVRKTRLEKSIIKNKSYIGTLPKQAYTGYEKYVSTIDKIEKMEKLLKKMEKVIEERKQFKSKNEL
jgi:nucleoid DNA-binding protein